MGGEGSMMQGIISLRNNLALRRKKRLFKNGRAYFQAKEIYWKAAGGELAFRTATPEQRALIRQKIRKEQRREKSYILLITVITIVIAGWLLVKFWPSEPTGQKYFYTNLVSGADIAEYNLFLVEGDKRMAQRDWYNALFEYDKAYNFVVKDYTNHSNLGLKLMYQQEFEDVNPADVLNRINNLVSRFPKRLELYRFRAQYYINNMMPELAEADFRKIEELLQQSE